VGRDAIQVAHRVPSEGKWVDAVITRKIPARW
jgi:hypothetical protein